MPLLWFFRNMSRLSGSRMRSVPKLQPFARQTFTIKLLLSNSFHSFQAAESTNHNLVRPAAVLSDQDQISIVRQQIEAGRLPSALFHAFDGKVGVIKSCFLSYHLSADLESATLVWIHFMTT